MPTKKQRRRRQKERRHEYEYVYVDEEGRELEAEEVEEVAARNGGSKQPAVPRGRGGRPIQPPTWGRVIKRGLIFAPFMFILISLLSPELSIQQRIVQTIFLLLIFLPFSYIMDTITYRMITRRQAKLEGGAATGRRER